MDMSEARFDPIAAKSDSHRSEQQLEAAFPPASPESFSGGRWRAGSRDKKTKFQPRTI